MSAEDPTNSDGQVPSTAVPIRPTVDAGAILGPVTASTRLGRNVADRCGNVVATITGNPRVRDGVTSVEPVLELNGDDDAAQQDITFDGDVSISGSLRAGRTLKTTGTVWVAQAVESVSLQAADGLHVTGGIIGKESGVCTVGGDVTCKFVGGGRIESGGDITVDGEVGMARIACAGRLAVTRGPIFGGTVTANAGISCHTLGKPSGVPTIVGAGFDDLLRARLVAKAAEIEANRKHVQQVRAKLAPLVNNQRALTGQQRERATELMWEAGERERQTDKEVQLLTQPCRAALTAARPEIVVVDTVHVGVTIRFPGVETVVATPLKGPLRIIPRSVGSDTLIVVMDDATGTEHPLESRPTTDPANGLVERFGTETPRESNARAKCIGAFVNATQELFKTMVRMPLNLAKPRLKEAGERVFKFYKISAVIHLTGTVQGCVWISFSEKVAIALASALSGEKYAALDDDARDALGEIANIIVGSAKRAIAEGPLNVSVPTLQSTQSIAYPPQAPVILLPFDTAAGRFIIEVATDPPKLPVAA